MLQLSHALSEQTYRCPCGDAASLASISKSNDTAIGRSVIDGGKDLLMRAVRMDLAERGQWRDGLIIRA